jgi:transcriptional regulator with XRE-family HTH domain
MRRQHATVDPSFPERLRTFRTERGLSYRALGAVAAYSHTLLWEIETGRKQPTTDLAARLDDVLATGGVLSRLITVPASAGPLTPEDEARLAYLNRHPGRVDAEAVGVLAVMLAEQRRTEDAVGSGPLIGPVTDELGRIMEVVRETSGPIRPQVVDLAAQWAQFAGWLNTSAGRPGVAELWFDRAIGLAIEANNRDLTSTVLSFKGHLAWTYGDVGPMVGLTAAAREISGVYPGEMAYDALQAARGHAVAGDRRRVESDVALSRDLEALAREYQDPIPPWHYYRDASFFSLERGRVWRFLVDVDGYARQAIDELTSGLAALEPGVSYSASYLIDLAAAHVADGNSRAAIDALDQVEQIASNTGSARLSTVVNQMRSRIR